MHSSLSPILTQDRECHQLWFSKQWRNFFEVGLGLTCKTVEGMSFVKWGGEQELDMQYQGCTQNHYW